MNKANRPTTRDRAVALAIQFRGQGTYRLGAGMGDHPHAESPPERLLTIALVGPPALASRRPRRDPPPPSPSVFRG